MQFYIIITTTYVLKAHYMCIHAALQHDIYKKSCKNTTTLAISTQARRMTIALNSV